MSQRTKMEPGAGAATALVVVLASTTPVACGEEVETGGQGGSGGTSTGTGTDTGTATGTGTGTSIPSTTSSSTADSCPDLMCDLVDVGQTLTGSAHVDDSTLTIEVSQHDHNCGSDYYYSWEDTPVIDVETSLGTLDSVEDTGTDVTILITLAPGTPGGVVRLMGDARGIDNICPIDRYFTVTMSDGGQPQIAAADSVTPPALVHRQGVRLALAGTFGTRATVEVKGIASNTEVQFSATGGTLRQRGLQAVWNLPERPGLYQIEAIVRDGVAVATDTLLVEVRPTVDLARG